MLGFNTKPTSVRSPKLLSAYEVWRKELATSGLVYLDERPAFRSWGMLASVDLKSYRVRYEKIGQMIRESGFDCAGAYLDTVDLPTQEFFAAAYEGVAAWLEPVFGWYSLDDRREPDFEFTLLPISSGNNRLYVLGIESWIDPEFAKSWDEFHMHSSHQAAAGFSASRTGAKLLR